MSTLKNLVDEIILEKKIDTLKLFYDIDVFIQEFKDNTKEEEPSETPEVTAAPPAEAPPAEAPPTEVPTTETAPTEAVEEIDNLLNEAVVKTKVKGELIVSREDAANIQTIQDIIDYLTDKKHVDKSIVEKVLDRKGTVIGKNILTPEIQEIILLFITGAGDKELADVIDTGDKIIIDIDYGTDKLSSVGFKINKNAGSGSYTTLIKKDGKVLAGTFDQSIINKQILFYRNSLEG